MSVSADGPYAGLAGHDATRALGTFSMNASLISSVWDDLLGLDERQLGNARGWNKQFRGTAAAFCLLPSA